VACVEVVPNLVELVRRYHISYEVWPEYVVASGGLQKVGFEVELSGSHSPDSSHLDPTCTRCKQVRAALLAIAVCVVPSPGNSVSYEIDAHSQSIMATPRLGNRPFVTVRVRIFHTQRLDHSIDACEADCLKQIRAHLDEFDVCER